MRTLTGYNQEALMPRTRSVVSHATIIALLTAAAGLAVPVANAQPRTSERTAERAAPARERAAEQLDIRRITLYRSGVGSFERRGMVSENAKVQLRFKTDQVNDILKSM